MKLVTLFGKATKMARKYISGKSNIGAHGRAMRLTTGACVTTILLGPDLSLLGSVVPWIPVLLFVPLLLALA